MSATGRSDVRRPDDFYSTPAWCVEQFVGNFGLESYEHVLDPCCGDGAILDVLKSNSMSTHGIELNPERASLAMSKGHGVLTSNALDVAWPKVPIITNPPYSLAMEFVLKGIETGMPCAYLLRLNWLAGKKRQEFHRKHRADIYVLSKRPSFTGNGTDATEYAWFLWNGPNGGGHYYV